ncbi:hypothetical protein V8C34DRAFT_156645, partial [Trichoderma compactum]
VQHPTPTYQPPHLFSFLFSPQFSLSAFRHAIRIQMPDAFDIDAVERRRRQNRLAQRKRRDTVKTQLQELEADNMELRAFKENIVRATQTRSALWDSVDLLTATGRSHDYYGQNPGMLSEASSYFSCGDNQYIADMKAAEPFVSGFGILEMEMPHADHVQMLSPMSPPNYSKTPHSIGNSEHLGKDQESPTHGGSGVEPINMPRESASSKEGSNSSNSSNGNNHNKNSNNNNDKNSSKNSKNNKTKDKNNNNNNNKSNNTTNPSAIKANSSDGRHEALRIAVANGHVSMVRLLIEHGADINASVGELGRTSLHDAVAENDAKMVELLLDNGADVSAVDGSGMTALQIAASLGHVDAAGVLLQQKGAKK